MENFNLLVLHTIMLRRRLRWKTWNVWVHPVNMKKLEFGIFSPAAVCSTGSTFNSSKFSSFLLWSKVCSEKIYLDWCQSFLSFGLRVQISLQYSRIGRASALYTFMLEDWTQVCFKVLFKIPSFRANFASFFLNIFFIFIGNFTTEMFKILYLLWTFVNHCDLPSYLVLS